MMERKRLADFSAATSRIVAELKTELERSRRAIDEQRDKLEDLREASVPKAEFINRMEAWVDRNAEQHREKALYQLSALRLPKLRPVDVSILDPVVRGASGSNHAVVAYADSTGLLCLLMGDTIKQRFRDLIEASNYPEGIPSDEREGHIKKAQSALNRLEIEEERTIEQAEAAGINLARRIDARPEIVLSLELAEEKRA